MNESSSSCVHLAVITDDGYVVPTVTMLTSVRSHKNPNRPYCVHVFGDNISEFAKRKFMELEEANYNIQLYDCSSSHFSYVEIPDSVSWTVSAMLKCELAELLPQLDRVLFLDGDILVLKDLGELYDVDLGENVVAAVREYVGEKKYSLHRIVGSRHYFNTGVMLLNLKLMREEALGEKIIRSRQLAPSTWIHAEQDPFNAVCDGRVHWLHPRYNFLSSLLCCAIKCNLSEYNEFYNTSYSSYLEMEEDAVIQHFAATKPWKNKTLAHASLWQKYHDVSPFGDTLLEHDELYLEKDKRVETLRVSFLGLLPLLSVSSNKRGIRVKFLGLPLFKIQKKDEKVWLLLFHFLPLLIWTRKVK